MTNNRQKAIISALILFCFVFIVRYQIQFRGFLGAGDFGGALQIARNILSNQAPYTGFSDVPYPMPAGFVALPFSQFDDRFAGTLFVALSASLLAFVLINKTGELWRLLLFLSLPFAHAMEWAQWSPLILASWYIPILTPLMTIIKPQIALPLAINRPHLAGIIGATTVLLISILQFPQWPQQWLSLTRGYEYIVPILIPLGWLLPLAALHWKDSRSRLLATMAIFPVRGPYDLLVLFVFPRSAPEMIALVLISWLLPYQLLYLAVFIFCVRPAITLYFR